MGGRRGRADRLSRHGRADLLFDKSASPEIKGISWAIFGFSTARQSEILDLLGLNLIDGRPDFVCEHLKVGLPKVGA